MMQRWNDAAATKAEREASLANALKISATVRPDWGLVTLQELSDMEPKLLRLVGETLFRQYQQLSSQTGTETESQRVWASAYKVLWSAMIAMHGESAIAQLPPTVLCSSCRVDLPPARHQCDICPQTVLCTTCYLKAEPAHEHKLTSVQPRIQNVTCMNCHMACFVGDRYTCPGCPNYNICAACYHDLAQLEVLYQAHPHQLTRVSGTQNLGEL
jgi:hypothetical protein